MTKPLITYFSQAAFTIAGSGELYSVMVWNVVQCSSMDSMDAYWCQ